MRGRVSNTAVEELDESAISALISFFQTLDKWDLEAKSNGKLCSYVSSQYSLALLHREYKQAKNAQLIPLPLVTRKVRDISAYLVLLSPLAYFMNCMKLPKEIREMFRRQARLAERNAWM